MAEDEDWESLEYSSAGYDEQLPRISKPDMFMNAALWMEIEDSPEGVSLGSGNPVRAEKGDRPLKPEKKYNKAGAVVVLPNDRVLSVDRSYRGVHAAVSALNKFGQERAEGCQVYLSRRPCSFCAKLLVQCEVAKVFYLPTEPELDDPEDVRKVDKLFKASSTGLSIYIPQVSNEILGALIHKRHSPFLKSLRNMKEVCAYRDLLIKEYWSNDWIKKASTVLQWPAFKDPNMQTQTKKDMKNLLFWIAVATKGDVPDYVKFLEIDQHSSPLREKKTRIADGEEKSTFGKTVASVPNEPTPSDNGWQSRALHMCRMAQMLSQRSDDPAAPVGCVLMMHNQVAAIGWNGFPAKALYGEFPSAKDIDKSREEKEPYVIHAEQNALLTRNKRNMSHKSSVLFSNKIPCGECIPMLIQAGVKNVVVPHESVRDVEENTVFNEAIKEGTLNGFWPSCQGPTSELSEGVLRQA